MEDAVKQESTENIEGLSSMHLQWFGEEEGEAAPAEGSAETADESGSADAGAALGSEAGAEDSAGATDIGVEVPAWVTSQLPKDLREEAALHGFKNPGELARAFLDASRKAEQGLTPPGEEATEEQWRAYREAIGVPDTPDGYEFEVGEGEQLDEELTSWFRQAAHEAGLSAPQAQKLLEKWNESNSPEARAEKLAAEKEQVLADLRKEWGKESEGNLNYAFKAMDAFGTPELREYLDETGMGNDPRMIKAFTTIGKKMLDDSFVSGQGGAEKEMTEEEQLRQLYPRMYAEREMAGR